MSFKDYLMEKINTKIKTANNTETNGVLVGVDGDGRILLFKKTDYDGKGNLNGKYKDITNDVKRIMNNTKYPNLMFRNYSVDAMKELGFTETQKKQLRELPTQFLKQYKN
jgi:hypothetical protein